MKFWVYVIDWRAMSIDTVAECSSDRHAVVAQQKYVDSLTGEELVDLIQFKTIAATPVSAEMEAAVAQFSRLNGRTVA